MANAKLEVMSLQIWHNMQAPCAAAAVWNWNASEPLHWFRGLTPGTDTRESLPVFFDGRRWPNPIKKESRRKTSPLSLFPSISFLCFTKPTHTHMHTGEPKVCLYTWNTTKLMQLVLHKISAENYAPSWRNIESQPDGIITDAERKKEDRYTLLVNVT